MVLVVHGIVLAVAVPKGSGATTVTFADAVTLPVLADTPV
jgi:hypothetical protein